MEECNVLGVLFRTLRDILFSGLITALTFNELDFLHTLSAKIHIYSLLQVL